MMKLEPRLLLTACVCAATFFWIGYAASPGAASRERALEARCDVRVADAYRRAVESSEDPAEPSTSPRVMEARCDVRVAEAYLQGIESSEDACGVCRDAVEECSSCEVAECGQELRKWRFDVMGVGIQTVAMDVEQSHWEACCRDLSRVWPTPSETAGTYPEDFPAYCR